MTSATSSSLAPIASLLLDCLERCENTLYVLNDSFAGWRTYEHSQKCLGLQLWGCTRETEVVADRKVVSGCDVPSNIVINILV
jgi:hypothetical protein